MMPDHIWAVKERTTLTAILAACYGPFIGHLRGAEPAFSNELARAAGHELADDQIIFGE